MRIVNEEAAREAVKNCEARGADDETSPYCVVRYTSDASQVVQTKKKRARFHDSRSIVISKSHGVRFAIADTLSDYEALRPKIRSGEAEFLWRSARCGALETPRCVT